MTSSTHNREATSWWTEIALRVGIGLTVLSLNFLGDWLRDCSDPRLRQI